MRYFRVHNVRVPVIRDLCYVNSIAKLNSTDMDTTCHQYSTLATRTCHWPITKILEAILFCLNVN